jgi:GTP diphosphokinase / guanosine-3',5'-bis(diphosphate) 3'-diphosphatase
MNQSAPSPARAAVRLVPPGSLSELPKPPGPDVIRQCNLTQKIHDYDPRADTSLIDAAYDLAEKAHSTQRRENGDPYFTHPAAVAGILADYGLDVASPRCCTTSLRTRPPNSRKSKPASARKLPAWSTA